MPHYANVPQLSEAFLSMQDWYDGVKSISVKAPKMTFSTGERSEIRSLNVTAAISKVSSALQIWIN